MGHYGCQHFGGCSVKLLIFDIDGTLTDTNDVDLECYFRALSDEFGANNSNHTVIEDDLVTDSGFAQATYAKIHGIHPPESVMSTLKARFMRYLQTAFSEDPRRFQEIPGASHLLARLMNNAAWGVAIATGCWLQSATFKLEQLRISFRPLPTATSDDAPRKSSIVSLTIQRALQHYAQQSFSKIVFVGDRHWDLKIAEATKLGFIGRGSDGTLALSGASCTVRDYLDPDSFMHLLETVSVPNSGSQPASKAHCA